MASWSGHLDDLVRSAFHGYRNHMSRGPDADHELVVAGYAEWARTHIGRTNAACLVLSETGNLGIAAVTAAEGESDTVVVSLAGIVLESRRAGRYGRLLDGVEGWALRLGRTRIRISTQADNVAVQRAWARHGYLPERTEWIVHLRPVGAGDRGVSSNR